ncbi:Lrp/AsnC family transcriptional regulator [Ideonella sp. DXS22W]|uniref:siroheme decarboxylase n=1 Tax=Pseudaquabacterium inlustre TaxID=2984192 RepID=A0ABU9CEF4_9BURK
MDDTLALLNPWQQRFPLDRRPFATVAAAACRDEASVIATYRAMNANGKLSRIGGVFGQGAGGAALLAGMQVPAERLEAVAAIVSAHPGVNHNYEREHAFNLWFVMTGRDAEAVDASMAQIARDTGLPAVALRMRRAYRIDLGFDLRHRTAKLAPDQAAPAAHRAASAPALAAVSDGDRALAALVEEGLPLLPCPYDAWAQALGRTPEAVLATLAGWLARGTLRRFGAVVRHHELGFGANAMTVFDVPDECVDACGEALAQQAGVTLAYRRERAPGWRYNLFCMVHGRDREAVRQVLARVVPACGLAAWPQAVLFSRRRFKQTGARRFRDLPTPAVPGAVAADLPLEDIAHAPI